MKPYEIIEHTADIGVRANGRSLKELFENAARGMFAIIAGDGLKRNTGIERRNRIQIKKETKDIEELLVDWLSELLYLFNKKEVLYANFKILELNNSRVAGEAKGAKIDPSYNALQTEIKAVTFHGLKIEKHRNSFSCKIIFDV